MKGSGQKKLFAALIIVLTSLAVLSSATYAWMEISRSPQVTDLAISVVTETSLMLAPDIDGQPGDWSTILDMSDHSEDDDTPSLRPVTYVAAENNFSFPTFGQDGRIKSVKAMIPVADGITEGDSAPAAEGYMYVKDFWMRTGTADCNVSLSPGAEREDGVLGSGTFVVGEPEWVVDKDYPEGHHINGGGNAQHAIRVGFLVHSEGIDGEYTGESVFVIYEPNADGRINEKEPLGIIETKSVRGGSLEGDNRLIRQLTTSFEDVSPSLIDTVNYSIGEFTVPEDGVEHATEQEAEETAKVRLNEYLRLWFLKKDQARRVTMFVWLEGQDEDCTNAIASIDGKLNRILANFQFVGVDASGHYLVSR